MNKAQIRHVFGTVRQLKSGRYQARYTGPDGKQYAVKGTTSTRLEAQAQLATVQRDILLGTWQPPTKPKPATTPTVSGLAQQWLASVKPTLRTSSYATYTGTIHARIIEDPGLTTTPVTELTRRGVSEWWQRTSTRFPGTAQRNYRALQKLKTIMEHAITLGYRENNPVSTRVATSKPRATRKDLPSTQDLRAVLEAVPERYRLVTALVLFHGLRLGEALALKGKHFHFTNGTVSVQVEGTLARVPNPNGPGVRMVLHPPKTSAGYRYVPVLPEFIPLVVHHLATFCTDPEQWATTTRYGEPVFDTSYRSIFNNARQLAGVEAPLTPHYGRVWLTTALAEHGATPTEIGQLLGQVDLSTVTQVYMRSRTERAGSIMRSVSTD